VLFAASLGLITVVSTGLWASTDFSLLLRWRFEIRILPIRRANFGPSKFPDASANLVEAPPGRVYRGSSVKPPSWLPRGGTGTYPICGQT
jgi:hypothetical protein